MEGDARARVSERKGSQPRALCVVNQWWESGKSVFHFERLKVQTSIYSTSQIILSSTISNNTGMLELIACEQAIFFSKQRACSRAMKRTAQEC